MFLNPNIRIGCSGWQYKHWRGDFYPAELPQQEWLGYYAERFDTVEINNTFYRLPEAATFASWGRRAPRGFVYAVKASRYLTHMKKLKDPEDPIRLFFTRAKRLGHAFGPVLYQLPPRWPVNVDRLETFLAGAAAHAPPRDRISRAELVWRRGVRAARTPPGGAVPARHGRARRPGSARSVRSSTFVFTARRNTPAATAIARSTSGPTGSPIGIMKAVRSTRTSITTPAATRRATPCACAPLSRRASAGWAR